MTTPDSVPRLTPTQILALVVLMAEARELTNNELKELAGFSLTGADNKKLEKEGLVETDRSHRPYSHQLTDKGWRFVRELPASTPPKAGGSGIRSMFTLLANIQRSLDRLQLSPAEFFKQAPAAAAPAAPTAPAPRPAPTADPESAVRAAYADLAKGPGDWVGLADLRDRLDRIDRGTLDETLRRMAREDGVRIIPLANTKALLPRDREAALRIGGEDNHTIAIGTA
jgi:DNA-binding MarR family transcriptional regulator